MYRYSRSRCSSAVRGATASLNRRMIRSCHARHRSLSTTEVPRIGASVRSLRRERGLTIEQVAVRHRADQGLHQPARARPDAAVALVDRANLRRARRPPEPRLRARPRPRRSCARTSGRRSTRTSRAITTCSPAATSAASRRSSPSSRLPPARAPSSTRCPGDVEFVYVLEGTLELQVGEETHVLERGRRDHVRALEAAHVDATPSQRTSRPSCSGSPVPNPYCDRPGWERPVPPLRAPNTHVGALTSCSQLRLRYSRSKPNDARPLTRQRREVASRVQLRVRCRRTQVSPARAYSTP